MIFKKTELVRLLNEALLATIKTKGVPSFACIYFNTDKVLAQNGRLAIIIDKHTDLNILVPASKLKRIILEMGQEISLTQEKTEGDDVLVIESGANRTVLKGEPLPPNYKYPIIKGERIPIPFADNLINAIFDTEFSTATDPASPTLLGVHLRDGAAYATDTKRATRVILTDDNFPPESVSLTREICRALIHLGPPDYMRVIDENTTAFEYCEDDVPYRTIISTRMGIPFPEKAVEVTDTITEEWTRIDFPETVLLPASRVRHTVSVDYPAILVESHSDGKIYLSSESDEIGSSKEVVEFDAEVGFSFLMNPTFFIDALKRCSTIYYIESERPIIFKNDFFTCYVAPIIKEE